MQQIAKILKVIGLLTLIVPFFMKGYDIARLTIILLALILIEISLIYSKKSKVKLVLYPVILIIFIIFIDFLFVYFLNYKPIVAKEIKSSNNYTNYNALFYRTFECNGKTYFDLFYQKSDYCSKDLLEEKDINTISSDIIHSFKEYKDRFYLIDAKVSYKEGNNIVELKSYNNEDTNNMNGNVTFNDNIVYKLYFNNLKNVNDLKVDDNIKLVGRIDSYKKNKDNYIVKVKDVYIPDLELYNNYQINVVNNKDCQKDKTNYVEVNDIKYYTSCLSNIYVVYSENEVYELNYVLKDEKINLDNLLNGYKEIEDNSLNAAKLYKYEKYNILKCDDKNIIIGDTSLNFDNNYCDVKDSDNNDL